MSLDGQQGVLHHRHIGGVEHPFEPVAVIQPLGQRAGCGSPCPPWPPRSAGCSGRRGRTWGRGGTSPAPPGSAGPAARICPIGARMACLGLVRGQGLEPRLRRQLDVDAEPVRQEPQLLHQLRRGAGDGLGVDVAVEAVAAPAACAGPGSSAPWCSPGCGSTPEERNSPSI